MFLGLLIFVDSSFTLSHTHPDCHSLSSRSPNGN